jgi:DNA-binding CsgD family transcriptional regulator/tetratricopeptide (TPR) repeat protein
MTGGAGRRGLLGRRNEQAVLAGLLQGAREGRSGVLVLRGEAGIGKTTLLTDLVAGAAGLRVLQISGAESEMELAYAGVHHLCAPLLDHVDRLPKPQRLALRVAWGMEEGDAPDRFLVGLAVLTLLGEAAAERPTVCTVDDAQWVDAASLQTLAFVARRFEADPIVMVFAEREAETGQELVGLPGLSLTGLGDEDARALLATMVPGRLDDRMQENILAEAGGNPLALEELHGALTPEDMAGGYGLATARSLATRIERTFGRRLRALPPPTRTLLLIAAAEPSGRLPWLWAAAESLGIGVDAAVPAESTGLITIDGRLRFRHPLVRSAIYRDASLADRRQAHGALAGAIAGPGTEEHRAWHRAHATGLPDELVAGELVQASERARARGGVAAAAAFLALAVELTPEPYLRAQRALDAAQLKIDAGAPDAAGELLSVVGDFTEDEFLTACGDLLRARLAFAVSRGSDAPPLLLAAAIRLGPLDAALSRDAYLAAMMSAIVVGRLSAGELSSTADVATAARLAPPAPGPSTSVDRLLDGLIVRLSGDHVGAAPLFKAAIRAYLSEEEAGLADPRWLDITNRVSLDLFDQDTYNLLAARNVERLRAAGALTLLPLAVTTLAGVHVSAGEFSEAAALLEEAEVINTAIGAPHQRYIEPYVAAYRGQEQLTRELVKASIDGATQRGEGYAISVALYSAAILHNGLGQYREALAACESAVQHDDLGMYGYLLGEMVEAATRCGEKQVAATSLRLLVERTAASGTETALGLEARSAALVDESPVADEEYRRAIAHLERSPVVVFLARAHLVYGEWLRRMNRPGDARTHLRSAHEMFTDWGAEGFAERTRRELEATGEVVRLRSKGAGAGLTTQEAQITKLAREGYTNAEIGGQLFISTRTVEWHLSKIFAKLGITSRRELRTVF